MIRFLRFFFPILSVSLLASAYYFDGFKWPCVGILIFGVLWIVGLGIHWDWVSPLALFAVFSVAALDLLWDPSVGFGINLSSIQNDTLLATSDLDHSIVFLFSAALCAFIAWDLAEFHSRLLKASPQDNTIGLERRHLLRLLGLIFAGSVLSTLALTLRLDLSFEWLVIIMLLTVWGIGRVVNWLLKRES
jgi:hypothetical protein